MGGLGVVLAPIYVDYVDHSMTVTILKVGFAKRGPKIIIYRDYKIFDIKTFGGALKEF